MLDWRVRRLRKHLLGVQRSLEWIRYTLSLDVNTSLAELGQIETRATCDQLPTEGLALSLLSRVIVTQSFSFSSMGTCRRQQNGHIITLSSEC